VTRKQLKMTTFRDPPVFSQNRTRTWRKFRDPPDFSPNSTRNWWKCRDPDFSSNRTRNWRKCRDTPVFRQIEQETNENAGTPVHAFTPFFAKNTTRIWQKMRGHLSTLFRRKYDPPGAVNIRLRVPMKKVEIISDWKAPRFESSICLFQI